MSSRSADFNEGKGDNLNDWNFPLLRFLQTRLFMKALVVAVPNGVLAAVINYKLTDDMRNADAVGVSQVWTGYNFVLGFLIVFRTTHAYGRFWEGATLLHQMRGEWFNAISSLIAFSSAAPEKRTDVLKFQNFVIRLASMLHCAALQEVSVMEVKKFETIEVDGLDPEALQFLQGKVEKSEVLLQWIQRLVVEAHMSGVVPIAPPILSRVFQELSRGIVNLNSAKRITDVPFPLPYTLMLKLMLVIQWIITPMVCALVLDHPFLSGVLSMITVFAFWSTVHIAAEIENPFGDDQCDLPLTEFQFSFNKSLLALLDTQTQNPPAYSFFENSVSQNESALIVASNISVADNHRGPLSMIKVTTRPHWLRPPGEALRSSWLTRKRTKYKTFRQPRRNEKSQGHVSVHSKATSWAPDVRLSDIAAGTRNSSALGATNSSAQQGIGASDVSPPQAHARGTVSETVAETLAGDAPAPEAATELRGSSTTLRRDLLPALTAVGDPPARSALAKPEEKWSGCHESPAAASRSRSPGIHYEGSNCVVWAIGHHVDMSDSPPLLALLEDTETYESRRVDFHLTTHDKESNQAASPENFRDRDEAPELHEMGSRWSFADNLPRVKTCEGSV